MAQDYGTSQVHSEYIARWRLYLWFQFLETGDASHFLIPEDKKMAKKAKDKINRMEVLAYVGTLFRATKYPLKFKDNSRLCDPLDILIRKDDKTYKHKGNINVHELMAYIQLKEDCKAPAQFTHYSYVNNHDVIVVESSSKKHSISGIDVLALFNHKSRVYNGKHVIAEKDESDYCCLYFEDKKGKKQPITGAEAKIIGAAIMADLAKEQCQKTAATEVFLVQGYAWDGRKDDIAEYYSNTMKSANNLKDRELVTLHQTMIKEILLPLNTLIDEWHLSPPFKLDNSVIQQMLILKDQLLNEMSTDTNLKKHLDKNMAEVAFYAKSIRGAYADINEPKTYIHIKRPSPETQGKGSVMQFSKIINDARKRNHIYQAIDKETRIPVINSIVQNIKDDTQLFNEYSENRKIKVTLQNDKGEDINSINSLPYYLQISSEDGIPISFDPVIDSNLKITPPIVNNGIMVQRLKISDKFNPVSDANESTKPEGCLSQDMEGEFEYSSSHANKIIRGFERRNVSAEDVRLVADAIFRQILEDIPQPNSNIKLLTIRKVAYLCVQILLHQSGTVLPLISQFALKNYPNQNISVKNESTIDKFMSLSIDKSGNLSFNLTAISKVEGIFFPSAESGLKTEIKSYINESIAVESKYTVNIYEKDPVFTMKQQAELKDVPELRPEQFFNNKQKPGLFSRIFGQSPKG